MNWALNLANIPIGVSQSKGVWYVGNEEFFDGINVDYNGNILNPKPRVTADQFNLKKIDKTLLDVNDTRLTRQLEKHDSAAQDEDSIPFNTLENDLAAIEKYIKYNFNPVILRVVSMYEHGGIAFNLGMPTDPFDSGIIGFAYIKKEDFDKEGISIEIAKENLINELKTYQKWVNNEVYFFTISENCEKCGKPDVIDSVCGFYDFDSIAEYAPEEFKEQLKNL